MILGLISNLEYPKFSRFDLNYPCMGCISLFPWNDWINGLSYLWAIEFDINNFFACNWICSWSSKLNCPIWYTSFIFQQLNVNHLKITRFNYFNHLWVVGSYLLIIYILGLCVATQYLWQFSSYYVSYDYNLSLIISVNVKFNFN